MMYNYNTDVFLHQAFVYFCVATGYQEGSAGILVSGLVQPHFCACPKPGPRFRSVCVFRNHEVFQQKI